MIKALLKLIQIIYCIYALLMFITIMLIAFPFIILATPFGIKGGNFIYKVCYAWAKIWYITVGISHKEIYKATHNKNKQYIFVANHISYMDIPPIVLAIKQPIRVLGKYEMVKIPIFGLIYRSAVILVNRKNAATRAKSVRALKAALNKGISIFIFPEGTFNQTNKPLKDFYDGAFKIAIETQTNIKPILFIDTVKRLHYKSIFSLTPGINRVIYLEEVNVKNLTLADINTLKKQVYTIMEKALIEYNYPLFKS